jgi:PX domain
MEEIIEETESAVNTHNNDAKASFGGGFQFIEDYIQRADSVEQGANVELTRQVTTCKLASFRVTIPTWQKTASEFIEYRVSIQYLEGSARQEWDIHRRYSDFQELHYLLQEYFLKNRSEAAPAVPPKLASKNLSNEQLEVRRGQLEDYLKRLLALKQIPSKVLEFIEFNSVTGVEQLRTSVLDDINHGHYVEARIPNTEIVIDEN